MLINRKTIETLRKILDGRDIKKLTQAAEKAEEVERRWERKFQVSFNKLQDWVQDYIEKNGKLPKRLPIDMTDLVVEHSVDTMRESLKIARTDKELDHSSTGHPRLSKKPPTPRMPSTIGSMMELWDDYRKNKTRYQRNPKDAPPAIRRQLDLGDRIMQTYLDKLQEAWKTYGRRFITGDTGDRQEAIKEIMDKSKASYARAKTIVETETTYYYNEARQSYYDELDAVTHYLFVALRDQATTDWCKTRQGIVYKKGSKILQRETPPIHYNCRSELLPLTPQNPKHKALIDDKRRSRSNRRPKRLPEGWEGRS